MGTLYNPKPGTCCVSVMLGCVHSPPIAAIGLLPYQWQGLGRAKSKFIPTAWLHWWLKGKQEPGRHSSSTWECVLKGKRELCKPWPKFSEVLNVCADTDVQSVSFSACARVWSDKHHVGLLWAKAACLFWQDTPGQMQCKTNAPTWLLVWTWLMFVQEHMQGHEHVCLHPCMYRLCHMNFSDCKFSNYLHIFENFTPNSLYKIWILRFQPGRPVYIKEHRASHRCDTASHSVFSLKAFAYTSY